MKTSTSKLSILYAPFGATSCSSNDSSEDETIILQQNLYDYCVDNTLQKSIDQFGIIIHKDITPPNVEGIHKIDPFRRTMSNFNDALTNTTLGTLTLTLFNQISIGQGRLFTNSYANAK
ncbi:hypothetical protein OIU83_20090 [Flavobacterium sp. LS1R49]|uniref:Uncharacterized protein n=1 Tax=Flavobacterium shii TaxID=2987687 RepID=A0A9X2ZJQ0_9FLAO|nr:hypothetical protein [Flavobacterium shii]MCV9929972.1 hypothetical protein [Flavobacterium shii]